MIIRHHTEDGCVFFSDARHDVLVHSKSGHLGGCPRMVGDNRLALLEMVPNDVNTWFICDLDGTEYPQESHGSRYDGGSNSQCINWAGSNFYLATSYGVQIADGHRIEIDMGDHEERQWRADFHQALRKDEWHVWCHHGQTRFVANETADWNFHRCSGGHREWHELAREADRYYCRLHGGGPWYTCNLDGSDWKVWRDGISHPAWRNDEAIYSYRGKTVFERDGSWIANENGQHYQLVPGYAIFSKWDKASKKNYAVKVLDLERNSIVWSRDILTHPVEEPGKDYDYYAMARPCLSWDAKYAIWHYRDTDGACCVQVARTGLSDTGPNEPVRDMKEIRYRAEEIQRQAAGIIDITKDYESGTSLVIRLERGCGKKRYLVESVVDNLDE